MIGVNISGGEYGSVYTGVYGYDYIYPSKVEIDYYSSKGMDVIRVPFQWERLQTNLNGPLDATELGRLKDVVSYANSKGIQVILDSHDYGTRVVDGVTYKLGIDAQAPGSALADFWGKMADAFKSAGVMYGLMNEPHFQTAAQWVQISNAAIAAIRDAGGTQKILVPGTAWTTASTWVSSDNDTIVGLGTVDKLNNFAFDVHQYLDANNSGTSAAAVSADIGWQRLVAITQWARANDKDLFLGEFAAANNPTALAALDGMLNYMDKNADVWLGGAYWGAGAWWGNYMFSIEPSDLALKGVAATDKPQMDILEKYDIAPSAAPVSHPVVVPPPAAQPVQPAQPAQPTQPAQPALPTLTGSAGADEIKGTKAAEVLLGLAGNDKLHGTGNDILKGGAGNDIYFVATGDQVIENAGEGTDLVQTAANHTLGANLENLTLTGSAAVNGTGNELANILTGNGAANVLNGMAGKDTLIGGGGKDILTGGTGADTFVFGAAVAANADTVMDFSSMEGDRLQFRGADYGHAKGVLEAGAFEFGTTATKSHGEFLFDTTTGVLSWDADGSGSKAAIAVANFAQPVGNNVMHFIHASDILFV